jgi:hypothetical protein
MPRNAELATLGKVRPCVQSQAFHSLDATCGRNLSKMTFVPYTLQTILNDVSIEPVSPPSGAVSPTTSTPRTLFSRQRTSPISDNKSPPSSPPGVGSRFRALTSTGKQGIEAVEAWGMKKKFKET